MGRRIKWDDPSPYRTGRLGPGDYTGTLDGTRFRLWLYSLGHSHVRGASYRLWIDGAQVGRGEMIAGIRTALTDATEALRNIVRMREAARNE